MFAVLTAALFLSVGIACGMLLSTGPTPKPLTPSEDMRVVNVSQGDFSDPHIVQVKINSAPDQLVRSNAPGTATYLRCEPGVNWESGESNVAIDGAAKLNLKTTEPLWRDIEYGTRGSDVLQLREALAQIGLNGGEGPIADWTLVSSFAGALQGIGIELPGNLERISLSDIVWLPPTGFTPSKCIAAQGEAIGQGDAIALSPGAVDVTISGMSPTELSGERQLSYQGISTPLDAEWKVTSPTDLAGVQKVDAPGSAGGADSSDVGSGIVELIEPVKLPIIPPSSILEANSSLQCVFDARGAAWPIRIFGSRLGQVYVEFTAGGNRSAPQSVLLQPPAGGTCDS